MCEILYSRAKEGSLGEATIRRVMKAAQEASSGNPHGCGVFNREGAVWKTEGLVEDHDIEDVAKLFEGSKEVVVHLRYGTVGHKEFSNVHPFRTERYTLCHNGRMNKVHSYGEDGDADSKKFLMKLVDQEGSTVEKIEESLAKSGGWFSIFTLDKKTGRLFYYRERANFEFRHTDQHLYGATDPQRIDTMTGSEESENRSFEPEEGTIFEVGNQVRKAGEFDTGKDSSRSWSNSGNSGNSSYVYAEQQNQQVLDELYEAQAEEEDEEEDQDFFPEVAPR